MAAPAAACLFIHKWFFGFEVVSLCRKLSAVGGFSQGYLLILTIIFFQCIYDLNSTVVIG